MRQQPLKRAFNWNIALPNSCETVPLKGSMNGYVSCSCTAYSTTYIVAVNFWGESEVLKLNMNIKSKAQLKMNYEISFLLHLIIMSFFRI